MKIKHLIVTSLLSAVIHPASAKTMTWADLSHSTQYDSGASWINGAAPGTNDFAIFNTFSNQPFLDISYATSGLIINAAGFHMSGNGGLTLREGGVVSKGAGVNTIDVRIAVNGNASSIGFDVEAGNTLVLGKQLTFSGKTWIKTGEGTLKVNGPNVGDKKGNDTALLQVLGGTLHALNTGFSGAAPEMMIDGARFLAETAGGFKINSNLAITVGNGGATFENALNGWENVLQIAGPIKDATGASGNVTFKGESAEYFISVTGNNSYSGTTTVDNVYLRLTGANAIPTTSTLTVINGGVVDINIDGATRTLGGLAGDGVVRGTGPGRTMTYVIGTNHESTEFSGTITDGNSGHVNITKTGFGTLTLSGENTYTGATVIRSGKLFITKDGSLAETAVTLEKAELGGGGSVEGTVTTSGTDSVLAPSGIFTLGGLDATEGARFVFELGADLLRVTGEFTGSTQPGRMLFDFTEGVAGVTYNLLTYGFSAEFDASTLSIVTPGYELDTTFHDGGWFIDTDSNTLQVRFAAVPEPGTHALILGALVLCAATPYLRRRA